MAKQDGRRSMAASPGGDTPAQRPNPLRHPTHVSAPCPVELGAAPRQDRPMPSLVPYRLGCPSSGLSFSSGELSLAACPKNGDHLSCYRIPKLVGVRFRANREVTRRLATRACEVDHSSVGLQVWRLYTPTNNALKLPAARQAHQGCSKHDYNFRLCSRTKFAFQVKLRSCRLSEQPLLGLLLNH